MLGFLKRCHGGFVRSAVMESHTEVIQYRDIARINRNCRLIIPGREPELVPSGITTSEEQAK
jgi:hypothetical protein